MSKNLGVSHRTTKVSVRRLMALGAISGVAVLSGVSIASASTTGSTTPGIRPLHVHGGLPGVRPVVDGKVTAVGAGGFTVLDRSSTSYTVTVTGTTTYTERNVSSAGIADVTVGTFVDVVGSVTGTNVTATRVRIEAQERPAMPMRRMGTLPAAAGKVTTVGTNTFTVVNRSGTSLTVDVSSSTTYVERGVTSGTFADLKVGDFAAVTGSVTGTTVTATAVHFGAARSIDGTPGSPGFDHRSPMAGGPMGTPGM